MTNKTEKKQSVTIKTLEHNLKLTLDALNEALSYINELTVKKSTKKKSK